MKEGSAASREPCTFEVIALLMSRPRYAGGETKKFRRFHSRPDLKRESKSCLSNALILCPMVPPPPTCSSPVCFPAHYMTVQRRVGRHLARPRIPQLSLVETPAKANSYWPAPFSLYFDQSSGETSVLALKPNPHQQQEQQRGLILIWRDIGSFTFRHRPVALGPPS